jgi:hypothetical protein
MAAAVKRKALELTPEEWLDVRSELDQYFGFLSPRERRSWAREIYDLVQLRHGAFGVGVDLKALPEVVVRRRRERRDS